MLFVKNQQLVICLLGAMFITDFIFFGYMPLRSRLKDIAVQKNAQQIAIAKACSDKGQLPVLRQQLAKLEATVANFQEAVPQQRDFGGFVQKIGGLMMEHNLKDQLIQPSEQVNVKGLNCIHINMHCKGNIRQIFGFFKQLQNMDRMVRVEEVKLVTGGDFTGQINMEAKATIYCQAEQS